MFQVLVSWLFVMSASLLVQEDLVEYAENLESKESAEESAGSLLVLFWNLENFFDYEDGGNGTSDHDFSSSGNRHWSASRFYRKCGLISKSVLWIASHWGRIPDVAAFAEVEGKSVLYRLLSATALRKMGYKVIHWDSPDHRGIDVALLFRENVLSLLDARPVRLYGMATRDILQVHFQSLRSGQEYDFLVCHLPSKYGGKASVPLRCHAAAKLRCTVDSVQQAHPSTKMVVMGDFNEVPESQVFDTLRPVLQLQYPEGNEKGSIRFNGRWEWIDLFWTTFPVREMSIVRIPFLMTVDNVWSGEKPLRTYIGPRYVGGVSDHLPIVLEFDDSR